MPITIDHIRCEVLNASYDPLSIVSGRRALVLCLKGKASVLTEHPTMVMKTSSTEFKIPTQILLREMVKSRPTTRVPAQLTQRNMFIRDKYTCQYCNRHKSDLKSTEFLTRDHIHPQEKGGKDVWTNIITACNKCNNKKANMLLKDSGLTLLKEPKVPTVFEIWSKTSSKFRKMV